MTEPNSPRAEETIEYRLAEVLDEYCRDVDQGLDPAPHTCLSAHPELAGDLTECLEAVAALEELGAALGRPPVPPPAFQPRTLGDFELLAELGRGGMGVVYKARQLSLDRLVALKMIRAGAVASANDAQRFCNEAAIVAHLDHPAIVPVYEVGEHQGELYYSMKLIDGGSLAEQLDRFHADPRAAARLLSAVAEAVHHAHQRGVLHRDLKPSNILLDAAGQPHVTDFGLAKRITTDGGLIQSGTLVGTPSYMAPEQASGKKGALTTAADVYGLGGILYAMLTGRPPFEGDTLLDTLEQVRGCEAAPPGATNPRVDRDLETICLKCLRKEPSERYGSADALARDLERWLAGEPIKARPVSRFERLWRWARRHPALTGAIMVAAALVLAVSAKTVSVARERVARLEEEVLRSNVYAARGVASTVLWQLERLSEPVLQAAAGDRLRALLRQGDRDQIDRFLQDLWQQHGGGRAEHDGPFATWYVLDHAGHILAIAPPPGDATIIGRDFRGRDYFQGTLRHAGKAGRASVHISRVFLAENQRLHKFAISVAVCDGPRPDAQVLGVLAATVTTTSTLGSLELNDRRHRAVLVGRRDTNPPRGPAPVREDEEYLILLHPAYNVPAGMRCR